MRVGCFLCSQEEWRQNPVDSSTADGQTLDFGRRPAQSCSAARAFRTSSLMAPDAKRQTSTWGGGRGRLLPSSAPQGKYQEVLPLANPSGRQLGRPRGRWATRRTRAQSVGQWPTAFLWGGAGACTLRRKRIFQESAPSACCQSRFCLPTEGNLRSLSQRARGGYIPQRPRGQLRDTILGGASCEGGS